MTTVGVEGLILETESRHNTTV